MDKNTKKIIHLAGAGGAAGIGMARCLKDQGYSVQGHDASPWGELIMECAPETEGEGIHYTDLIIPIPDPLVKKYCDHAYAFCPRREVVELCQDKAKTAEILGDLAPKTYWLRDTAGAGGKGAQMISEYLPGRNYSIEACFYNGELIGQFQKERISYLVKSREPNVTVSGSSAVSICTDRDDVWKVALEGLFKVDDNLHGFYGVDLREDENGKPKITEINAGRLLTASYVYFYLTEYNLALAGVKRYFNEGHELGKYPKGYGIIRQIDKEPVIFPPEITKKWI